jgi:hypothetical protein
MLRVNKVNRVSIRVIRGASGATEELLAADVDEVTYIVGAGPRDNGHLQGGEVVSQSRIEVVMDQLANRNGAERTVEG